MVAAAAALLAQPASAVEGLGPTIDLSIRAHVEATQYTFACGEGTIICGPLGEDFAFNWAELFRFPSTEFASGPSPLTSGGPTERANVPAQSLRGGLAVSG
jgi:hypothetical protein